ncbi:MAG: sugar ABC transporter permease [Oscillospiraceae bacterium]|nr:sugar ABC transporter permease [Oscillospiraceae bacterium]
MQRRTIAGYMFISPLFLLFAIFIIYPIIFNIYVSFFEWNGIRPEMNFTGIENYINIFKDPVMVKIIRNFVVFAFFTIIIQAFLGISFASFFIRSIKGSDFYRTVFYIPVIATPAIIGNIFSRILETNRGQLNEALRAIGLDFLAMQWLADPKYALGCIIAINIWQWTGYSMLMYYANMLNIPSDIYEAATVDGARPYQQFFRITIPLLRSTHFTLFIMGALGSLKCFDLPYILTKGGPNYATEFFPTYINKKSFELFDQGGASALTVIMLVIAMIITLAQVMLYTRNNKDKELAER